MQPSTRFGGGRSGDVIFIDNYATVPAVAIARFPATAEVFLAAGRPPSIGASSIVRSDDAHWLRQIADEGPETLYTGALAHTVVADTQANGGLITLEDLANCRVHERSPVRGQYRAYDILSATPPSSGAWSTLYRKSAVSIVSAILGSMRRAFSLDALAGVPMTIWRPSR
jgi:hypothetical protein